MRCAWQAYLNLLPLWLRSDVDKFGAEKVLEVRLRNHCPPELITTSGSVWLNRSVEKEDLTFAVNIASGYSPWTAETAGQGYITAPGGHRIGLCGRATVTGGNMTGISFPTSLCIRVAKDFSGIARNVDGGSILILGSPGSGKTTLLRDLIRQRADSELVSVVDERGEIFPTVQNQICFPAGRRTDVMTGCSKKQGIEAVLRSMNPQVIAVDEITAEEDCQALLHAGWCGVSLLATAHAANKTDLYRRPVYKPLVDSKLFDTLLILRPDRSWRVERIGV